MKETRNIETATLLENGTMFWKKEKPECCFGPVIGRKRMEKKEKEMLETGLGW